MITLQRVDLRELDPKTFELLLPGVYYTSNTIFPVTGLPIGNPKMLSSVPCRETLEQTFDREGIRKGEPTGIWNLVNEQHQINETCFHYPSEKWRQNVIIPCDIQWGDLTDWAMNCTGCSQTDFYPVGFAKRDQIREFLARYTRR